MIPIVVIPIVVIIDTGDTTTTITHDEAHCNAWLWVLRPQ